MLRSCGHLSICVKVGSFIKTSKYIIKTTPHNSPGTQGLCFSDAKDLGLM